MPRLPLPPLPPRKRESQKGDYGKILVVAGSRGMSGAVVLVSEGAYRMGAGLVYLAVPDGILDTVAARQTCAVLYGLPHADGLLGPGSVEAVLRRAEGADVVALGPGLGSCAEHIRPIVRSIRRPLVLDADGLNAFAEQPDTLAAREAPAVLTPHPGELGRLIGRTPQDINRDRVRMAQEAARRFHAVIVLKGHGTVVADGDRSWVNPTGNAGMATGGAGDILTGMIAALMGQGMAPFDAARLGVYLHGGAGDLGARKRGMISLMATDLLDFLPAAILRYQRRRT